MTLTADAVEHSEVIESAGELRFTTLPDYALALNEKDIQKALQKLGARPMRIKIASGQPATQASVAKPAAGSDEVSERALGHPEVQRFQELFPDSQVRAVRNLKE